MDLTTDATQMASWLRTFERAHWAELPPRVQSEIEKSSGPGQSFVVLFANVAEAMYADPKGHSNKAKREILGQLAYICGFYGWHGFRDGRGFAIQQAMARDNGETPQEGASWPDADKDPAINDAFAPAAAEAAPEA